MANNKNNEIIITGSDGQLQLLHTIVENNNRSSTTAIICHPHPLHGGTMTNKVVHIINKAFNSAGLNSVRFNFRGVEKSQGEFANGVGEVDDLLVVLNWLKRETETTSIYLAGFSFGSFIAAQLTTQKIIPLVPLVIEKLLLVAPPVSMYDYSQIDIKIPCLVIQGAKDTVVDPEQVRQWVDSQDNNVQLEWHSDAEHFFHGKLNFIHDTILNYWF